MPKKIIRNRLFNWTKFWAKHDRKNKNKHNQYNRCRSSKCTHMGRIGLTPGCMLRDIKPTKTDKICLMMPRRIKDSA